MSGFHGAFATGVASQQGTLTLPDTWFRPPFWDLLMLQLLRPNSSNLPCLYSTFHLEYPLVLSRFYFEYTTDRVKIMSVRLHELSGYHKITRHKQNMAYLCVNLHKSTANSTHFHSHLNGRGLFPVYGYTQ